MRSIVCQGGMKCQERWHDRRDEVCGLDGQDATVAGVEHREAKNPSPPKSARNGVECSLWPLLTGIIVTL